MNKIFFLFFLTLFSSCGIKNYQTIPYFTDLPKQTVDSVLAAIPPVYLIQKGDAFNVEVSSANSMASALFTNENATESGSSSVKAYQVDSEGFLRLPLVGSVKVTDLTLIQARTKIETTLATYLKDPVVNLKLVNFRVSVLGDVAKPGAYLVEKENIDVLELLSLAGDLNITAKRDDLLLIRSVDGKKQFVRFDLQRKNLFASPYFYLKNGDMLYVQPSRAKSTELDPTYRNVGLATSIITVIILVLSQIKL